MQFEYFFYTLIIHFGVLPLGIVLILAAYFQSLETRPRRRVCFVCQYDLRGAKANDGHCPECGGEDRGTTCAAPDWFCRSYGWSALVLIGITIAWDALLLIMIVLR